MRSCTFLYHDTDIIIHVNMVAETTKKVFPKLPSTQDLENIHTHEAFEEYLQNNKGLRVEVKYVDFREDALVTVSSYVAKSETFNFKAYLKKCHNWTDPKEFVNYFLNLAKKLDDCGDYEDALSMVLIPTSNEDKIEFGSLVTKFTHDENKKRTRDEFEVDGQEGGESKVIKENPMHEILSKMNESTKVN